MTKRALCIGINNYPGTQDDLSGCVNDANDWKACLEQRGFQPVQILLDRKATKEAIYEAMRQLITQAQRGDTVVITYSGHGSWRPDLDGDEEDGRDELLCPYDIAQNRPITDDELYDIFAERNAGSRIVLIADSCHSGSLIRVRPIRGTREVTGRFRERYLPPDAFLPEESLKAAHRSLRHRQLDAASRPFGGVLLSGCQDLEVSWDANFGGRPNGAFTYYALQALKNLPVGATYRDWHSEIRQLLQNSPFPQTPNLQGTRSQTAWKVFD